MRTRTTLVCGAAAAAACLALGACSSDGPASAPTAGTGDAAAGTPGVTGGSPNAGGASQPNPSAGSGGGGATAAGAGATTGGTASTAAGGVSNGGNSASGAVGTGMGSSGGSAGSPGTTEAKPSMGCDQATAQAPNQWVDSMVMTGGAARPYSVRLPSNYDQKRAYPVVVLLHGCGSGTNNVPMEKATGADAILVRGTGSAASTCWDTSANGPDVAFFDAMVLDVKARFCADEQRLFIVGYSSGSWLVNQLACIRTDVVRGGASVSGGESSNGKCGSPVARIFIHDTTDTDNAIAGGEKARDRQLTQNSCSQPAVATPVDPSPCTLYQGCTAGDPVEWCQTSGKAHGRQDDFAPSTFWNFFKAL